MSSLLLGQIALLPGVVVRHFGDHPFGERQWLLDRRGIKTLSFLLYLACCLAKGGAE